MIIYTKDIEDNNKFLTIIEQERTFIDSIKSSQKILKNVLLDYMQKLADSTDNVDTDYANTVLELLKDFKNNLKLININIEKIDNLLCLLDDIKNTFYNNDINTLTETITPFNTSFLECNNIISKNTLQIEEFFHSILNYLNFIFIKENTILEEQKIKDKDSISATNNSILENTLIISETKGKIFLPYTLEELNNTLKNNPERYSSIEDVIEKDYTLSYNSFRSPAIARFRETYKLMKLREKASFFECIDLALELSLNTLLNPAVISACKNQDELDIYLDYLDNNETEKFDIFKVIYEIAPKIVNKK